MSNRPHDLPDFAKPPLNEVVLGVQFSPPQGYQQIRAGEVWELFKAQYPLVQEHQAIAPAFEIFGLPYQGSIGQRVNLITGASHDRFWFLSHNGDELIQFQQDRLLHNWRKVGDQKNEYPRFERMAEKFAIELRQLEQYMFGLSSQPLAINQCEISYINHIEHNSEFGPPPLRLRHWFAGVDISQIEIDDLSVVFREIIRADGGQPVGRLTYEITEGVKIDGSRLFVLNLTARGAPTDSKIESAIEFLKTGRALIVRRFSSITSDAAHKAWGRIQ